MIKSVSQSGALRRARPRRLGRLIRRVGSIFHLAARRFLAIDGMQWAAAFAFNAFFSLFPLVILVVTLASSFVDRDEASKWVIGYVEHHVPIGGVMQRYVFDTIAGVITARDQAGAVALLLLVWVALQCFTTLVCAINRAWGTTGYKWWRIPMKSLLLLGLMTGALLVGTAGPLLVRVAKEWLLPVGASHFWVYGLPGSLLPWVVLFGSLSLFYRLAPHRPTRFAEVWGAALCATGLMRASETLFVLYLTRFATFNAVYGTFGGIMALLLWIYLTGCVLVFGACLCAAQAETGAQTAAR